MLKCVNDIEAKRIMHEVHKDICAAHKLSPKMGWLIRRYGYYWPTITANCVAYTRGCEACQVHRPLQRVLTKELHAIMKPWLFRGWTMDLIGMIHPPSSKHLVFIIVATNYSTKWVEAQLLVNVTQVDVIKLIKTQIMYQFGVPETITMDKVLSSQGKR